MKNSPDLLNLINDLTSVVDWAAIFPRSTKTKSHKPDLRKKITPYQRRKIMNAAHEIRLAGGVKSFHPLRKSKKRVEIQGLTQSPGYLRGYISPFNVDKSTRRDVFDITFYNRDTKKDETYTVFKFPTPPTGSDQLRDMIKRTAQRMKSENFAYIGVFNNSTGYNLTDPDDIDLLINNTVADYEKYDALAGEGAMRPDGKGRAYAPELWMTGLIGGYE